jgi:aspartyl-tRNA(Asn)/glutamyl-tRNA(Gln) amidotransferase subunit B
MAKDILAKMLALGDDPEEIMQSEGISLISDDSAILEIVREVIEKNAKAVGEYKAGKENALQFLVGQGMAKSKGQADPNKLRELFAKELA